MRVNVKNRGFRRDVRDYEQRVPKTRWELMKNSGIKGKYETRTEELVSGGLDGKRGWKEMSRVMMMAATKEVCGVTRREVASP